MDYFCQTNIIDLSSVITHKFKYIFPSFIHKPKTLKSTFKNKKQTPKNKLQKTEFRKMQFINRLKKKFRIEEPIENRSLQVAPFSKEEVEIMLVNFLLEKQKNLY